MTRQDLVATCLGVSHRTAPVKEREKVALSPDELPEALVRMGDGLNGAVVISTCNRTELYSTGDGAPQGAARMLRALAAARGEELDPGVTYYLVHEAAVRHLFRVSAGIDSMVLGESQILGQVRDAMAAASQARTLNGVLSRLFHSALRVGKRARSQTDIGRYSVSVSSAAVTLAQREVGSLDGKTVLVVSAGSTGKLAAHNLTECGASRVLVTNRTPERARALAGDVGGRAVPFSRLRDTLTECDIVISGSGAGEFIIRPETVTPAAANRNGIPLLVLDIAVPRDVDPAVRDLPGVRLFDIDDIEAVSRASLRGRRRELLRVDAHVEDEVDDFMAWWDTLDVLPVIADLRNRAEEIRRREVERALRRLPQLGDEERRRIEAMTEAIVKKMLDRPIARLKDGADTGLYIEALEDLFGPRPETRRRRRR